MDTSKNERLVIDGNSFYEIDLQCIQKKAESEAKAPKRAVGPGTPTPIKRHATGEASIYNAKKAEGLTSARHWISAATAVVSTSTSATAEQEQYNDDPA